MAKDRERDRQQKGKRSKQAAAETGISVRTRAGGQIRRIRAWCGLAFFLIAAGLSLKASVPLVEAGLRALVAGVAGYLLGWACGVMVWRHLLEAEQRAAADIIMARHDEARRHQESAGDHRHGHPAARAQRD